MVKYVRIIEKKGSGVSFGYDALSENGGGDAI